MSNKNRGKFLVHLHLEELIQKRFGAYVDVEHSQFNPLVTNERGKEIKARTTVWAYQTIDDAKKGENPIAVANAECSKNDAFVKREGLTLALRRLYRDLASKNFA